MIGYELIQSTGESCALLSFALASSVFFLYQALVQYWGVDMTGMGFDDYYGVGPHADTTSPKYDNGTPILLYRRTAQGWAENVVYGQYATYSADRDFTWKWIKSEGRMGWVQDDPEPHVTVFISDGLREPANEILESLPKEQYK